MSRLRSRFLLLIGCLVLTAYWMGGLTNSAWANQWAPSVGEAKLVQFRTRDISDRVNRTFPFSPVAHSAMHLDNSACQLLDAVKCGAAWNQVQALLHRTCSLAGSTNALINEDCNVRNDRRVRDYMIDLSKRIDRLECSLDKDFARTQPAFCPPQTSSRYRPPLGSSPIHGAPNGPWGQPYHPMPNPYRYPQNTYDYDNFPMDPRNAPLEPNEYPRIPNDVPPFGNDPEALPPGSQIGPIQYRVDRNQPRNGDRAATIAQIGIEVLRMLSN